MWLFLVFLSFFDCSLERSVIDKSFFTSTISKGNNPSVSLSNNIEADRVTRCVDSRSHTRVNKK